MDFAKLCFHESTKRINDNFVRCVNCGQSIIKPSTVIANKTRNDFTQENTSFNRNFDRNFSNEISEPDKIRQGPVQHYSDRYGLNFVTIDWTMQHASNPPKYTIIMNGEKVLVTEKQIDKLLHDMNAIPAVPKN